MNIEIKIDGIVYPCDQQVFQRILSAASFNLNNLKNSENGQFPAKDRLALTFITRLQFKHSELL